MIAIFKFNFLKKQRNQNYATECKNFKGKNKQRENGIWYANNPYIQKTIAIGIYMNW